MNVLGGSHDYLISSQRKSFQIKQDGKFFSKLLTKENPNPKGEASSRILYYGKDSSAVPFMWESQPGTPKHRHSHSSLPPLTPPPSYQNSSRENSTCQSPKHKFPFNIFRREHPSKKNCGTPTIISTSSTLSSCSSESCSSCPDNDKSFVHQPLCFSGSSLLCFGVPSIGFRKEARATE